MPFVSVFCTFPELNGLRLTGSAVRSAPQRVALISLHLGQLQMNFSSFLSATETLSSLTIISVFAKLRGQHRKFKGLSLSPSLSLSFCLSCTLSLALSLLLSLSVSRSLVALIPKRGELSPRPKRSSCSSLTESAQRQWQMSTAFVLFRITRSALSSVRVTA